MQLGNPPISSLSLQAAIDAHPLTVAPSTPVLEAISLVAKSNSDVRRVVLLALPGDIERPSDIVPLILPHLVHPGLHEARPSCVLVMSGTALVGLLTERDIVRLAAGGMTISLVDKRLPPGFVL
ncbi:MAG: hypothetical protein GDA56_12315 [Hormoscilla sp. GM7CHS1pb]|nr:hypothetical protein [Hormoscilla sp. GM7CHS1pb]